MAALRGNPARFVWRPGDVLRRPGGDAPFAATGPDLSGLGDLLNLSRQEVLDALFDAAIDSFDLALPDAAFGSPDQPRVPPGSPAGGEWTSGGGAGATAPPAPAGVRVVRFPGEAAEPGPGQRAWLDAIKKTADNDEAGFSSAPFYSPDQPRDELGRWTATGGGVPPQLAPLAELARAHDDPHSFVAAVKAGAAIRPGETIKAEGLPVYGHVTGEGKVGGKTSAWAVTLPSGERSLIPKSEAVHVHGVHDLHAFHASVRRTRAGLTPAEHAANRAAAGDAVRAFAAGQGTATQAEAEALAGHLARLTVAGLHALKAEHGLKGGAPNKAALVAKLAERFAAWRAGRAPKEAVPDWPEGYDVFGKRDVFADEPHDPGTLAPVAAAPAEVTVGEKLKALKAEQYERARPLYQAAWERGVKSGTGAVRVLSRKQMEGLLAKYGPGLYGGNPHVTGVDRGELSAGEGHSKDFAISRLSDGRYAVTKLAADGEAGSPPAPPPAPEPTPPASVPPTPPPAPPPETVAPGQGRIVAAPARYAKGQVAVRIERGGEFKTRAHRLADAIGGRWSGREKAYIMSPTKAARLESLHAAGYDANVITGQLEAPPGMPAQAARRTKAVAAPAPPAAPGVSPYHLLAVARAFRKSDHNLLSLAVLRERTGLSVPEMHAAVQHLRREGALTGAAIEGRHGITAAEKEAAIREYEGAGGLIGYVSVKDPGRLAEVLGRHA